MPNKQKSNPINIPYKHRSYSVDLDTVHFSPPELRDRVETSTIISPELEERIEKIPQIPHSLPNIKIERYIGYK